jgi:hypothetical protein
LLNVLLQIANKLGLSRKKKDPIYLQCVTIHAANGGKGEGCLVEEYSVALLC